MSDKYRAEDLQNAAKFAVNSARESLLKQRTAYMNGVLAMGSDAKRAGAWAEYGWPEQVSDDMLYNLYSRGGLAAGAVDKLVGKCWETMPQFVEGELENRSKDITAWEKATSSVISRKVLTAFAEADQYRLAGRFGALLLRFADGKQFRQPVGYRNNLKLVEAIPVWYKNLTVTRWQTDTSAEDYGRPLAYQYQENTGAGARNIEVHADRIFILGSVLPSAIGYLQKAYNNFINIEKIEGGGGESFLKNAARQLNVNYEREVNLEQIAKNYNVPLKDLNRVFNEHARQINEANDLLLVTQGATVTPMVATVSDPQPHYDSNLCSICASIDFPSRILIGNQSGERSSTEDRAQFNARCQARRSRSMTDELTDFVRKLMKHGAVDTRDVFSIYWDDLTEPTRSDKLANAKTMSEINAQFEGQGRACFTMGEVRDAAGFEPVPPKEELPKPLGEELPDGVEQ